MNGLRWEKGSRGRVGVDERCGGRTQEGRSLRRWGGEVVRLASLGMNEDGDPSGHPDREVTLTPETGLGSKRKTVRNSQMRTPASWCGLTEEHLGSGVRKRKARRSELRPE